MIIERRASTTVLYILIILSLIFSTASLFFVVSNNQKLEKILLLSNKESSEPISNNVSSDQSNKAISSQETDEVKEDYKQENLIQKLIHDSNFSIPTDLEIFLEMFLPDSLNYSVPDNLENLILHLKSVGCESILVMEDSDWFVGQRIDSYNDALKLALKADFIMIGEDKSRIGMAIPVEGVTYLWNVPDSGPI